jgi:ClpP class serine protease
MAGLKVEVFKSGPHKGMGMQGTSLTDAQRAMLQERVDQLGAEFKATVRSERDGREGRKISDECMQGQTFSVKECLVNGLIDAQMSSAAAMSALADLKNIRRSNYTGRGRA